MIRLLVKLSMPLLLLLLFPMLAIADETEPYQTGLEAFNAGNYDQALTCFNQALARGNRSPGLYYNLGVTGYKTGRYDQAANAFERLTKDPAWRALALYNLGLIAEARGQREAAFNFYSTAQQMGSDSRLAVLAGLKLKTLTPEVEGPHKVRPWYGLISAGAGYDDNAMLAPDDTFEGTNGEEDGFVELYAAGGRYLSGGWDNGIRLDGGLYARGYANESDYNAATVFAGITRDRQHTQWKTRAGLAVNADFDDEGHYATNPSLDLVAEKSFATHYRFKSYNTLYWVEANDDYDYLTGVKDRCGIQIALRLPRIRVSTGCEVEYNDRDDLYAGDEFFSYSPFRGKVDAALDLKLTSKWRALLKGAYRKSIYPDANIQVVDDASITRKKREDDRWNFSLRGEYALTDILDLFGEYRHTDNDSNISSNSYTCNQIVGGLSVSY
ncbi:MAG: tetratricopeptide repeat protein [Thermodesulfobacteriota bacterium]